MGGVVANPPGGHLDFLCFEARRREVQKDLVVSVGGGGVARPQPEATRVFAHNHFARMGKMVVGKYSSGAPTIPAEP